MLLISAIHGFICGMFKTLSVLASFQHGLDSRILRYSEKIILYSDLGWITELLFLFLFYELSYLHDYKHH